MLFYMWLSRRHARRKLPTYASLIKDPVALAAAINSSREDGLPERVRTALVISGIHFVDNVRLMEARREALENDPSKRVRCAALLGLTFSANHTISFGTYPEGAREAMSVALKDENADVRKGAKKMIAEFDRAAKRLRSKSER
jgi:hypothetical protein